MHQKKFKEKKKKITVHLNALLKKSPSIPNSVNMYPGLLTPAFVTCSTHYYCKRQKLGWEGLGTRPTFP